MTRNALRRRAVPVVAAVLLAGCATLKHPGDDQPVTRVYLDIRHAESGAAFSEDFRDALIAELGRYGVRCSAGERDLQAPDDAGEKMRDYYPDVVIALLQTDARNIAAHAEFSLEVFRPNSSASIFSEMFSPESGGWVPGSASRLAGETVAKLDEEGLLGSQERSH